MPNHGETKPWLIVLGSIGVFCRPFFRVLLRASWRDRVWSSTRQLFCQGRWGSGVERLWCTEDARGRMAVRLGPVDAIMEHKEGRSYRSWWGSQLSWADAVSVSSFGYGYLCCLCIKHPDANLKFAWSLWDLSLHSPKEYWYSLIGSFLCWCESISWGAQSAVSHPSSHLTHLQRYVAVFAATCLT